MPDDKGVSAVLGGVMMIALMMTLIPGAVLMRGAISAEMDAQRVAAERAAWCARHPSVGPPTCEDAGPLPGYDCEEVELDVWMCTPKPPTPPTVTPPVTPPAVPSVPDVPPIGL